MRKFFLSLGCLFGVVFCLDGNARAAAYIATAENSGQMIELHVDDVLSVILDSNRTTGYGWRIEPTKGRHLAPSGQQPDYAPDPAAEGVVGSGGKDTFGFTARKPGKEILRFSYVGPGKHAKTARQVQFLVVVH